MKILVAPDKFKNSLSASRVCLAIQHAISSEDQNADILLVPLADGGEGTCEILTGLSGGRIVECRVKDPLFREIDSYFGLSADGKSAFIELAVASGLKLLSDSEKNPAYTSTVGTGELISHALDEGAVTIVLGIGGSATNDAGAGMCAALGVKFFDTQGKAFIPTGITLSKIQSIDVSGLDPRIIRTQVIVLCDVDNPLFGERGAAFIFAAQKGADNAMVKTLDTGLRHFHEVIATNFHNDLNFPGAGAAGGAGAGARFFFNAAITSGIEYMMKAIDMDEKIRTCDLIISGEGKVDRQTLHGKVVAGISNICLRYSKPLWVVCGKNELSDQQLRSQGISKIISLTDQSIGEAQAMIDAFSILQQKVALEFRNWQENPV